MGSISSSEPPQILFAIRDITQVFYSETGINEVLSAINLDIYEGECLLIAGSNGSGKTVLMKIVSGLLNPSKGEVLFHGKPLAEAGRELRRALGLVFQDAEAQIIGETVEEDIAFGPRNLGFPKSSIASHIAMALESTGLTEKRSALTRGLSGGEKRRLAIAGVIAMGCDTVIMDEPFANLDWPGVVQALDCILALKSQGKTVIILTHELEKVLALAERMVILHQGQIREDGTPEAVLERLRPEYGVRNPLRSYANVKDCLWR